MYKVFFNDTVLYLLNEREKETVTAITTPDLVALYSGNPKMLLQYIDMMEKSGKYRAIVLYAQDKRLLISDFKRLFRVKRAGGGATFHSKSKKLLFIYRKGHWDLPKGAIKPEESKREGAVREVIEETGIKQAEILRKLGKTIHAFRTKKGTRILKITYWYIMRTSDTDLTPQTSEEIEAAEWIGLDDFLKRERYTRSGKTYPSVLRMVEKIYRM